MTPNRTWDPIRFRRGTRGFAAVVTTINGLIVLGIGLFAAPAAGLPEPLSAWIVGLTVAAGIAHLVAAVGLVRARPWAARLTAYLAGAGIGASAFAILLITRAELDVFGAAGATTAAFFAFMIGWWLVGMRFALQAFAPDRRVVVTPVAPAAPIATKLAADRQYVIRPMPQATFA